MTPEAIYHYPYPRGKALLASCIAVFLFGVMPILRHFFNTGSGSYGSYPVTVVQYALLGAAVFLVPHLYQSRAMLAARHICTCLFAFIFLYLVICYAGIEVHPLQYAQKYIEWQKDLQVLPFAIGYFVVGVYCGAYKNEKLLSGAFFLQAAFVLVVIGIPQVFEAQSFSEYNDKTDYQYWGDGFAFLALMFVTTRRTKGVLLLSALLSVIVLFFIPSRSSLICAVLALSIYLYMRFPSASMMTGSFVVGFALFFFIGMGGKLNLTAFIEAQPFSRQTYFLVEGEDTSLNKRREYSATGMQTIYSNPFFGKFGYHIEKYSESGTYMHNIMDIWAQAGMVPFFIFAWFIAMSLRYVYSKKQLIWYNPRLSGISLLVFSIASLILSRNQGSIHILFGVGASVGAAVLKWYFVEVQPRDRTVQRRLVHP